MEFFLSPKSGHALLEFLRFCLQLYFFVLGIIKVQILFRFNELKKDNFHKFKNVKNIYK